MSNSTMKLISLLTSTLAFLMCGVMFLFSTSDVSAQVPQTKRSDQDSFLKNIRSKKRNNDLQKARQQKRNSDSSDDWKIRIRNQSGEFNEEEGENRSDYKKDVTDVKIWSLIIGRIGISNLKQHYYSIDDVSYDSNLNVSLRYNTESTIISYTFGDKYTLSVGTTVEIKGDIYVREKDIENNTYTREYSSTNLDSKYSNIFYYIDTITIGFEFYGIEFLIGTGNQDFKFKDFKCDSNDCSKSADEVYSQTKIKDYWMDFGIGIVF